MSDSTTNKSSRIFFFSFSVSGGCKGDSHVMATAAKDKEEAKEKFKKWLTDDGFVMSYVEHFLETSIFEKDEFTRKNVAFHALGNRNPPTTEDEKMEVAKDEESQVTEFKAKADELFKERKLEEVVQIYHNFDHV